MRPLSAPGKGLRWVSGRRLRGRFREVKSRCAIDGPDQFGLSARIPRDPAGRPLFGTDPPVSSKQPFRDEFLLNNPQVARVNYSFEEADVVGSFEYRWLRLYAG